MNEVIMSAEDTVIAGIILRDLKVEAEKTGDYSKMLELVKKSQSEFTNAGQIIQALVTWTDDTLEGSLLRAEKITKATTDDILDKNKIKDKKVKKDNKEIEAIIDKGKKEFEGSIDNIVKDIIPKTDRPSPQTDFAQMLVDKINVYIKPKTIQERSLVKTIINELFVQSKETIEGIPVPKVDTTTERLGEAYKYREWSKAIKDKAQEYLQVTLPA